MHRDILRLGREEEVELRGIGRIFRRGIIHYLPVSVSPLSYVLSHMEELKGWSVVIVDRHTEDERRGVFVHTHGNITHQNPLLLPYNTPKSLSPVDGRVLCYALYKGALLEPTRDPPTPSPFPVITIEYTEGENVEKYIGLCESGLEPVLLVGNSYYYRARLRRFLPYYYVPYYHRHHVDDELKFWLKRYGVRKIVVSRASVASF